MSKYSLQLTLDNGRVIDAGEIEVRDGVDGKDGADGKDGLTTSVNGVEQVGGNVQLEPHHIGACPENENLVECVDGALKTLAGASVGQVRIATGTYTGTGTTAHSLTFEFVPRLVFITLPEQSKTIYNPGYDPYTKTFKNRYGFWVFGGDRMFLPDISFAAADGAIHPGTVYAKTTLDGTTLSLTGFDGTTTVSYEAGEIALNTDGVVYHYVAIG